jgi:hypothetical protein
LNVNFEESFDLGEFILKLIFFGVGLAYWIGLALLFMEAVKYFTLDVRPVQSVWMSHLQFYLSVFIFTIWCAKKYPQGDVVQKPREIFKAILVMPFGLLAPLSAIGFLFYINGKLDDSRGVRFLAPVLSVDHCKFGKGTIGCAKVENWLGGKPMTVHLKISDDVTAESSCMTGLTGPGAFGLTWVSNKEFVSCDKPQFTKTD